MVQTEPDKDGRFPQGCIGVIQANGIITECEVVGREYLSGAAGIGIGAVKLVVKGEILIIEIALCQSGL